MRPNQTLSALEDLFAKHRGHLLRKGVRLSPKDSRTVREVYTQWVLLMTDLGYLSLCSNRTDVARIISDLNSHDVFQVISTFADCVDLVRNQSSTGFKARLKSASPQIWGFIRSDVEAMTTGDTESAKRLIQAFSFTTRLNLSDINLLDESLEDYRATEAALPTSYPRSLVKQMNAVIKKWMRTFDDSDLVFRHGNGSVAGHLLKDSTIEVKYKDMFSDTLLRYAFGSEVIQNEGITTHPTRVSQTVFVPKSYKAFRTISKESSTLMFYQQGIWREMDRVMRSNRYLAARVDVHDQTRNQILARTGSLLRNYATIDLSAASDSVSWTLVKDVFRGTKVLRYLFATRSTHTMLPDLETISLKKFAPMGSALCFPVETIIFASLCEIATQKIARMRREQSIAGDYSVYGDDIIVPTTVDKELRYLLSQCGFRVNSSKSFSSESSWFRESCGGEYCDGFDVTPLRVSRNYSSTLDDVALTGCIDTANEAYRRGFRNLRAFYLKKLRSKTGFIPLFSDTSLLGDNYTNYHTKKKWNASLQNWEFRASKIEVTANRGCEDIGYQHWLRSTYMRLRVYESFVADIGQRKTVTGIDYIFGPQVFEVPVPKVIERHNPDA